MKTNLFTLLLLSLFSISQLQAQTVWERTFSKTDHDFKDYSITKAADGSNDLVLAGTLWDKTTDQYQAHVIRINDADATVVFEEKYNLGGNTWAMSITAFQVNTATGYAITGFSQIGSVRRTLVFTIDETGSILQTLQLEQGATANTNGMGLHIKATPNVPGDGFVVVGMIHDDISISSIQQVDKQGFCLKLDQSLGITWEKHFDAPLGNLYPSDYDVASFVTRTDQGYFITGGKNILTTFGQQRQGILAIMLDLSGNQLWDASYFDGNAIDNGASAWYDQASQSVYLLTNISAFHHFGISVLNASTGVLDNVASFKASSSNFDLDKYGHTLIKSPFSNKLLIQGRGYDFQWTNDNGRWQPAFLVDYDLNTQTFGVHYAETNSSQVFNPASGVPFNPQPLRYFYYPQSLVNIDAEHSAMVSYSGESGGDAHLIVRQFAHTSPDQYEFCGPTDTLLLDMLNPAGGPMGDPLAYTTPASVTTMPSINFSTELTSQDTFCFEPDVEPFVCEGNLVQNGDFEQGAPTAGDEDITNANNWGGIWSNAGVGFSSADFYSNTTGVPGGLQAPLPASQGQFAGFWSRIQGGDIYREGALNQLNTTIFPNTGIYELTFKVACLFTPNSPASLSIFVANGSINGGAALTSGTTPANNGLFSDSWEFGIHPIPTTCDNNFQTVTFQLDSGDPSFPATGINALFFTRTDGVMPGAYVAIDDVCLHKLCCRDDEAFVDAVQGGFVITHSGNTVTVDNALLTSCTELTIDWGDGTTDQVLATDLSVTHTYSGGGSYNISILVVEISDDGMICFEDVYSSVITDTDEVEAFASLQLFPNPARQRAVVQWQEPGLFIGGILRSASGTEVRRLSFEAAETEATLALSGLPKGLYFVQLFTASGKGVTRKLIKQ